MALTFSERLFFSEALFLELSVGFLLKVIPFKWIPRFFSNSKRGTGNEKRETLTLIKTAIQRSSQVSPWKNKCLISSLAARRMLNRRKNSSELFLGVALGENGKMIAHAWLKTGDFEVVEKGGDFRELFLF